MKKTIKKELNRLFPNSGIQTIHGKFSMRFELGGEGNKDNLRRIKQATVRGTEIFKQLIGEDELFLTIQAWKNEFFDPNNQNKNYLFQILKGMELKKKKGPFEQVYYKEDENGIKQEHIFEDPLKCDLFLGKATLSLEKISLIIKGIASLEMGEKPCISQNVFFFAINKQVGFRIYDDRGCEVWANSINSLRPLYENLNDWILDYNRKEIDEMFKKNMA